MTTTKATLLQQLSGGDLRSIGQADSVVVEASRSEAVIAWLFEMLAATEEPVVRMRAADALEKVARRNPAVLTPRLDTLLALLAQLQPKEIRWHLLQMAGRADWRPEQHAAVLEAVSSCFDDNSSIVKTSALQCLFDLRDRGQDFKRQADMALHQARVSGSPAIRARAKRLAAAN